MHDRVFVGVDWGTHSSKVCIATPAGKYTVLPICSSDVLREGECLIFAPLAVADEDDLARGLKGDLISHVMKQQFWGIEDRLDTGTTLGEAVTFSLCCLLSAAATINGNNLRGAELGFSFPNWIADQGRRSALAARAFLEAVQVAVHLVGTFPLSELPRPGSLYSIPHWKRLVHAVPMEIRSGDSTDSLTAENMTQILFARPEADIAWRFVVESCAAGVPYLRAMKGHDIPGVAGLAKLLVVDVGAGSTDVGYMLKVSHIETAAPNFYYFHPASSFPEAGNVLTEEIIKHGRTKDERITHAEAEARKIQLTSWHEQPFVKSWIRRIREHVQQYMEGVPDQRWLPAPVTLNIIVTGGSGLVAGLGEQIRLGVEEALMSRGFDRRTISSTRLIADYQPRFDIVTAAEIARRAVSFGAADSKKPGFRYMPRMAAPSPAPRTITDGKWV
jgi:hypothetical protein